MESEPRQELGLLDLQTADSTHQAPPPFTQQCVWKEILFYHWIVWEKTNRFYGIDIFSFHNMENLNPFGRQPACMLSGDTKILASSVLQNHPSPITLPQVPQLAGPSSSSLPSQFWGWSLMHHRWILAPNSFQMASQSKPPSNPLYFGYPEIVNDAEEPWVLRMEVKCSEIKTFERLCILEHPQ